MFVSCFLIYRETFLRARALSPCPSTALIPIESAYLNCSLQPPVLTPAPPPPHPPSPAEATTRRMEDEDEDDEDDKSRRVVRKWTVEEDQLMMQLVSGTHKLPPFFPTRAPPPHPVPRNMLTFTLRSHTRSRRCSTFFSFLSSPRACPETSCAQNFNPTADPLCFSTTRHPPPHSADPRAQTCPLITF